MRVAYEADDVEQREERSAVLGGDACRDVECAYRLGQVRRGHAWSEQHNVPRPRKSGARNNNARHLTAQLDCEQLTRRAVVGDEIVRCDAEPICGFEGDLEQVAGVASVLP